MANESDAPEPTDPLALGQAAAAQLGDAWQLDISEEFGAGDQPEAPPEPPREEAPLVARPAPPVPKQSERPPAPEQLIEAMLFVGGHPLAPPTACATVRGLTPDAFHEAVARLNKRYRDQRRPYTIEARDDGFVLTVRPAFRPLRERLFGGPRETRLSQPALDVLSVVAYRQPLSKAEVDAVRGTDSGPTLRQLVRLGLVVVRHRADATDREVRYGTAPRFLHVFGLKSLDELPRLGDAQQT
ncbi:MAG TPA: SMC-Scp complex subunit ScpB [Gemmata sp.]